MSTVIPAAGELRLALNDIRVRDNVRELDIEHVDKLARSIALRGVLVPLIVRVIDDGYELVAGYHRIAACRKLDLSDVPVVVRGYEGSSADSAAENVTRKQLTPLEEARAVEAMLGEGYTVDGAAQALGWSRQLVTAREDPQAARARTAARRRGLDPGQRDRRDARDRRGVTRDRARRRGVDRRGQHERLAAGQQRRLGDRPGAARRAQGHVWRVP
jgi:ParB-like chromosome segregation protein Spo0J